MGGGAEGSALGRKGSASGGRGLPWEGNGLPWEGRGSASLGDPQSPPPPVRENGNGRAVRILLECILVFTS